jgi:hypothetical protein
VRNPRWIAPLFALTALYDGLLGALFLVAPHYPFDLFKVTPPNHVGYVQFPAALLVIFAIMFAQVALDPSRHRNLIGYGILLKFAFVGVACWHWLGTDIPWMWKPVTVIDLVTGLLFLAAWMTVSPPEPQPQV